MKPPHIRAFQIALGFALLAATVCLTIRIGSEKTPAEHETQTASGKIHFKSPHRLDPAAFPARRKPLKLGRAIDDWPITPAEARQWAAESMPIANEDSRGTAIAKLISRLCISGYPNEAWKLIEEQPSKAKDREITAYFVSVKLNDREILDKILTIPPGKQSSLALLSYFTRIATGDLKRFILTPEVSPLLDSLRARTPDILTISLSGYFDWKLKSTADSEDHRQIVAVALDFHNQGLVGESVIAGDRSRDPFAKWTEFTQRISHPEASWKYRRRIISEMSAADPSRTVPLLVAEGEPTFTYFLRDTMGKWAAKDFAEARRWYDKSGSTLSPRQQDDVAWAFAYEAAELSQFDEAEKWTGLTRDSATREHIQGLVSAKIYLAKTK